jgi:hypothetical protein
MIEKSLGLAQKLEECRHIAQIYSEQNDDIDLKIHYREIADAIDELKQIHTGNFVYSVINISCIE